MSNMYVHQGEQELQPLVAKNVVVGNNQTANYQYKKISKNKVDADNKAKKVFDFLDKNYKYAFRGSIATNIPKTSKNIEFNLVNENFFKFYPLKVNQGSNFVARDYRNSQNTIPVLVGSSIKQLAHVGKKFNMPDPYTNKMQHYQVKGILVNNAHIPSLYLLDNKTYFNNAIITPFLPSNKKKMDVYQLDSGLQDLLLYDTSKEKINNLQKKINENGFYKVEFYPIKRNVAEYYSSYKKSVLRVVAFSLAILVITVLFLVWNLWQNLNEIKQESSSGTVFGFNKKQLIKVVALFQTFSSLLAIIPIAIFALLIEKSMEKAEGIQTFVFPHVEVVSLLLTFLLILFITIFASIITIHYFYQKSLTVKMEEVDYVVNIKNK
ncbi:hypothetical protein PT285_04290 [Lactobacillus sp. ESL0791]|uniref:ABC transporter permease n=1 Tax=Lactobacillus sp. ESL0791 TaxID=2983234 RepID=UPI0023FA09BE|nr:FtsX-like permease family protein [Lactobacillus sp. ESL0791]MDF7638618.1 hypothetical protein [Lactobacillus sp. ESL0791]